MKILQIVPTLGTGGAEHFVVELSNELCRQGHHVEILTLYDVAEDNPLRQSLDSRIKTYSLKKKKGFEPRLFYSVWQFIHRRKFDVVHGHVGAIKYLTAAAFLCRGVKFVATIHSEARREAGASADKWSRKLMFGCKVCVPVTISEESEKSFEEFYGRKAEMIFNGVSEYVQKKEIRLRDRDTHTVFLHPASCQPVKNQELLFSAFNRLLDKGYDAKVVWVGSNETFKSLYDSLEPLMQRNVSFLGVVDSVRDYMKAADAMCLSSKMEGMPMTIIEAFSVGCPVLCTPVGGCVDMIKQGKNGMMSDDLSIESYERMLEAFVQLKKEEREIFAIGALASFKDYSVEECSSRYLQVYQKKSNKINQ